MTNMNTYIAGGGSFVQNITPTNWPSYQGQQTYYVTPPVNDIAILLSSLFHGKICIYIYKLSKKQKILSKEDAEFYLGSFYPTFIINPFDLQGNLCEHISLKALHTWFAAEDGFSKFEFRYPENDKEKEYTIKTINVSEKFYIGTAISSSGFISATGTGGLTYTVTPTTAGNAYVSLPSTTITP